MRQLAIIIILLIFYFFSVGQTKTISISTTLNGDTTYWYSWMQKYYGKEFYDLTRNSDSLHFRISNVSEAIDVWTNNYKTFIGAVTTFINCTNAKKLETYKSFTKSIDTSIARRIYNIMSSNKVFDIPTQNKISGWADGLDGTEILIEYSTRTLYSFKEYWAPFIFKEIKQAQIIDTIQKQIWILISDIKFPTNLLSKDCSYHYNGIPGIKIKHTKSKRKGQQAKIVFTKAGQNNNS